MNMGKGSELFQELPGNFSEQTPVVPSYGDGFPLLFGMCLMISLCDDGWMLLARPA